jgi:hypothetical protein
MSRSAGDEMHFFRVGNTNSIYAQFCRSLFGWHEILDGVKTSVACLQYMTKIGFAILQTAKKIFYVTHAIDADRLS